MKENGPRIINDIVDLTFTVHATIIKAIIWCLDWMLEYVGMSLCAIVCTELTSITFEALVERIWLRAWVERIKQYIQWRHHSMTSSHDDIIIWFRFNYVILTLALSFALTWTVCIIIKFLKYKSRNKSATLQYRNLILRLKMIYHN